MRDFRGQLVIKFDTGFHPHQSASIGFLRQADLLVEDQLIIEVKAAKAIADEHLAQILGYLRSVKMEHGVLVNFGAAKFQIRKLAMAEALHQTAED